MGSNPGIRKCGSYQVIEHKNAEHAGSVDRTDRSVKKATVDDLSFGDSVVHDFHHPSDEGILEKIPEYLIECQT